MNSIQQRHDFSDVDEIETRKKKRKRSVSRDLSAELARSTGGQESASSKKTSHKAIASEAGKGTVLKIPVGNTLGAISGIRTLSQSSPAKRPRPSKPKTPKVSNSAGSAVHVTGTLTQAVPGTMTGSSVTQQIPGQTAALTAGFRPRGTSVARQIPLSATSGTLAVPRGEQAFISLATKGGTFDASKVSQSFTITRSDSTSVLTSTSVSGHPQSVQYIIRPQSQRHISVPRSGTPVPAVSGATVSNMQLTGAVVPASRPTSLTQSPSSPFKTVVNVKGRLPAGTQGSTIPMRALTSVDMPSASVASLSSVPASSVHRISAHPTANPQVGRTTTAPRSVSLAGTKPSVSQVPLSSLTQLPAVVRASHVAGTAPQHVSVSSRPVATLGVAQMSGRQALSSGGLSFSNVQPAVTQVRVTSQSRAFSPQAPFLTTSASRVLTTQPQALTHTKASLPHGVPPKISAPNSRPNTGFVNQIRVVSTGSAGTTTTTTAYRVIVTSSQPVQVGMKNPTTQITQALPRGPQPVPVVAGSGVQPGTPRTPLSSAAPGTSVGSLQRALSALAGTAGGVLPRVVPSTAVSGARVVPSVAASFQVRAPVATAPGVRVTVATPSGSGGGIANTVTQPSPANTAVPRAGPAHTTLTTPTTSTTLNKNC